MYIYIYGDIIHHVKMRLLGFFEALNLSHTSFERGLSKNICLTSHKSLPGDVLCLLPGGSIRLSGGGGTPPRGPFKCYKLQFIRTR